MKLLKVEERNYHIVYINDNENYCVYRRINPTSWEKYYGNHWIPITDSATLEKTFTQRDISRDLDK